MKSILESALMYTAVKKLHKLDERTVEILKSFIYVFWLLKFSDHKPSEKFNVHGASYELWQLIIETMSETRSWSDQHVLVCEELLALFAPVSQDAIERMAAITTVRIDLTEAFEQISAVHQERQHHFGNMLNYDLPGGGDAQIIRPDVPDAA